MCLLSCSFILPLPSLPFGDRKFVFYALLFIFFLEVFPALFLIEELTDLTAELGTEEDELKPETNRISNRKWLVRESTDQDIFLFQMACYTIALCCA